MALTFSDLDLLKRLVAFDSTSRNSNLPLADFLCEYLDRPGIRIGRNPSPDGTKTNLVFASGPAEQQPARNGLVLSGHMDVVPAEEPDWQSDPFTLTEADGRYVGRGTTDMKGFLAIAANALVAAASQRLAHPLVLVFTYDEEVGTLGAKHLVETWSDLQHFPRHAIIGEPTALRVVRMHKGHLGIRIGLTGKPAHSGYPHLGVNAIEPAARVITALAELRRRWETRREVNSEYFPEVPFVPLNVGVVSGGTALNVVPDRCELSLSVRLLPGMTDEQIVPEMHEAIQAVLGSTPYQFEIASNSPPLLVAEDAEIAQALYAAVDQRHTASASYATDAGWLQTTGMQCVIFGPGSIEVAHKPNEFLPVSEFAHAHRLLEQTVRQFCLA